MTSEPQHVAPILPPDPINWLTVPSASALINVGNRKVHLIVSGPPRKPGHPVVICESGLGHPGVIWGAVQSQCAPFVRTYAYDRAGYQYSDPPNSDDSRSATVLAKELSDLLKAAYVDGPYILVGHSFGGMLVREFIELRNKDVAGVVFVDVVTERSNVESPVPNEYLALVSGINFWDATGNTTMHHLSPADWNALMADGPHGGAAASAEQAAFGTETQRDLTAKKQFERQLMGDRPVVVIKGNATKDMRMCMEKGIEAGNGTKQQRKIVSDYLETAEDFREKHLKELLQLSSSSKWVIAKKGGHNVHITEPEVIADEIRIILLESCEDM